MNFIVLSVCIVFIVLLYFIDCTYHVIAYIYLIIVLLYFN